MFGYVKPFKPELKMSEFEIYNAAYCSLCREIGRSAGMLARFSLSYDFVLPVLCTMALGKNDLCYKKCRCFANPFKKRVCCTALDLSYCADASVCATYYKLCDDAADSRGIKKLLRKLPVLIFSRVHKKAAKNHPECDELFRASCEKQSLIERSGASCFDEACHPSASALEGFFGGISDSPEIKPLLSRLGYLTGRYVYTADALDDLEKDKKSGCYNPFLNESDPVAAANASLNLTISEMSEAADTIPFSRYGAIIKNIVSLGVVSVVREINARADSKAKTKA